MNITPSLKLSFKSGKSLSLETTHVMGILNVTPDSFSSVGRYLVAEEALKHAQTMVKEGATLIDVGAEATNPQLNPNITLQEEYDRLMPVIELLTRELEVPISVDTSKPEIMYAVAEYKVDIINDVRGLRREGAIEAIAKLGLHTCIMHMFHPEGRGQIPQDDSLDSLGSNDIVMTVKNFLSERVEACMKAGIAREKIILDPGIGHGNFGKNVEQNLTLIKRLNEFSNFSLPLLIGVSRKTFIGKILNAVPEERLFGSIAAALLAAERGAGIIRVHDVKETVAALTVAKAILD